MLKNKIDLMHGRARVRLTWHKRGESGEVIPVAIEYLDELEPDLKEEIGRIALRPVYALVDGTRKQMAPGTSAHFLALPTLLGRLGFRTRLY